jgi:hypothetical protein
MRNLLPSLGFIDETSLRTTIARTTGWSPRGQRPIDHAPFGHWTTRTFIAALREGRLAAPWVTCAALNRALFDLCVATRLVPTLQPGEAIMLENMAAHHSPAAAAAMRAGGACSLFLPARSPDLNPIEMAFRGLKALIRRAAARTCNDLRRAVGQVSDLFTDAECHNFLEAAGWLCRTNRLIPSA